MVSVPHIRKEVAQVCRFLAVHRMLDLWGHVSARIPASRLFIVTPRFGEHCLPRTITENDLLIVDHEGNVVDGEGRLPVQFPLDLSIYHHHADLGACIFSAPNTAMAFGICRRSLKPLVHSHAEIASQLGWLEHDGLFLDDAQGEEAARCFDANIACHQMGVGLWAVGTSLVDALIHTYMAEYLAQANYAAAPLGKVRALDDAEIHDLNAESSGAHMMSSNDLYAKFFHELDPGPIQHPWLLYAEQLNLQTPTEQIKAKLAFTCRILWHQGTLVTFLEHVSHRIPDTNYWLMSTVKAFGLMTPEDIATLDGDANWISGPVPPPFKLFHRDMLAARPDVMAIVHTHDILGRMYVQAGIDVPPIFRNGLMFTQKPVPYYSKPSLIFGEEPRRETIAALGTGAVVHELTHGTDFVAPTLEEATVNAIQREELLAIHNLAIRLGEPRPMGEKTQADILQTGPTPKDWWWYYAGEVGDWGKSAGGIERAV